MHHKPFVAFGLSLWVLAPSSYAACGPDVDRQLSGVAGIVESLRPDKPGQSRVPARNGAEYTAGQAQWMKGRLRAVLEACSRGDDSLAAAKVQEIGTLLDSRSPHQTLAK